MGKLAASPPKNNGAKQQGAPCGGRPSPSVQQQAHPAVLRFSMSKLDGSGSRLTTVASGHSDLNSSVEKPALAPAGGNSGAEAGHHCA